MTLTHELDLDILKLHLRTTMKFLGQSCQNSEFANRTDRCGRTLYHPYSRVAI